MSELQAHLLSHPPPRRLAVTVARGRRGEAGSAAVHDGAAGLGQRGRGLTGCVDTNLPRWSFVQGWYFDTIAPPCSVLLGVLVMSGVIR